MVTAAPTGASLPGSSLCEYLVSVLMPQANPFCSAFLCIAGYLIFASWINFTRYGARGWDLLPHSDTIRDIPYLLKDWIRRVLNTVQGTGSRGGYSAV